MDTLSPRPALPTFSWRWLVWVAYLAAWSAALLLPNPAVLAMSRAEAEGALSRERTRQLREGLFASSKTLHVAAYAVAGGLIGWLRTSRRVRWALVELLCQHALATEILQRAVPTRTGSLRDVGLDVLGITLGVAVAWSWQRSRTRQSSG